MYTVILLWLVSGCGPLSLNQIIININKAKLRWHDKIRYLGVYITSSSVYSCSISHSKQVVYRSFNATFGKVGRIASGEVVLELRSVCLFAVRH